MVVFSEAPVSPRTYPEIQVARLTEEAKQNNIHVCHILSEFECEAEDVSMHDLLAWCPYYEQETPGLLIGFIPSLERYSELYNTALEHNVRLVNSPDVFNRIMDFECFYPFIQDLTPPSRVIKSVDDAKSCSHFPLFIKGAVKSKKEDGWNACVAESLDDLLKKINPYLRTGSILSKGKVIAREIIPLRYTQKTPAGFPMGREFRVLLCNNEVLGYDYYWMTEEDHLNLSSEEEQEVKNLAIEVSTRLKAPLVVVDIGQDINDKWWVIEVGDPQFCGVTHMPGHMFWQKILHHMV